MLIGRSIDSALGRVSMAGIIKQGQGVPFTNMRVFGRYALVYVLAGSGRYTDVNGVESRILPGHAITVYPEIGHAYGPGPGETWDEIYIVFDGPVFDLWRRQGLLNSASPIQRLEPVEYWFRRIESVPETSKQSALRTILRLQELLTEIHDYQQAARLDEADRVWLSKAKWLLEREGPLEEFDLEEVAGEMGISYVGFRKKFSRLASVSPAKFHMKAVMDRACDLIRQEGPTNRELAHRLGFADEFHFSKRFKQVVGLSPSEFRKHTPRQA